MNKTIVGLGEILWDVFPEGKVLGGAPANFAYHVSQFGFNGFAVSAVGDDLLGKEILDSIEEKELRHLIETIDFPTGTVQVTLTGDGVPNYEICENVAWDNIPFTNKTQTLAESCRAVCFGSLAQRNKISRRTIKKFLQSTPITCLKIFDVNLRQHFYSKQIIEESLETSNVLKLNEDEIKIIAEMLELSNTDEKELCNYLLEQFKLDIVILTKGVDGSYIFTSTETSFLPTPKVEVVDTVGAGDSFTAAFVAALLSGKSISKSHIIAVETSAYVCQQSGAMPKISNSIFEHFK